MMIFPLILSTLVASSTCQWIQPHFQQYYIQPAPILPMATPYPYASSFHHYPQAMVAGPTPTILAVAPIAPIAVPAVHPPEKAQIQDRSSTDRSSSSAPAPVQSTSWWGKMLNLPNDLGDKMFPFAIRIATHGEAHLPIVKVGHSPFTVGAGLWGKPEINYGKHIHHHPHSLPSPTWANHHHHY